jgi:DNA-binding MarR family transcriptional regulator
VAIMSSLLQKEIRQSRPFVNLTEETFLNLQRTASALLQALTRFLREHELTPTQYNVLRILRGSHPETLTCGDIGGRMVTPDPDVTRLLDRLEKRGLVFRTRDTMDRRVVRATITDDGLGLLERLDEPVPECLDGMLGHLSREDLRTLVELLERARKPPQ